MKKITLILFLFICGDLFAQNQLLSSIDEFYDSFNSTWINNSGSDYSYDANGNLLDSTNYSWDSSSNSWIPSYASVYLYNSNNKITQELERDYNLTTQQFEDEYRALYTYNSSNDLTDVLGEEFINGAWVNNDREMYTYINNRISSIIFQDWNGVQWINEDKGVVTYNSNNKITSIVYEEWINNQWEITSRERFTFDTNGNLLTEIYEDGDGTNWTLDQASDYMYDANGNRISEESLYNGGGYKDEYTYDTSVLMSTLDHPFKDKTGLDFIIEGNPNVNKLIMDNEFEYNTTTMTFETAPIFRTNYNYNSTLSTQEVIAIDPEITIFPNPATDILTIEATNTSIEQITLYNILGKEVLSTTATTFKVSQLADGIYIARIEDVLGNKTNHKIIKN